MSFEGEGFDETPTIGTRLIVMRHAKSDWDAGVPDFDRPLNERGRANAALAGEYLRGCEQRGIKVDHAVVSPSARTQETWRLVGLEVPTTTIPELYHANAATILSCVIAGSRSADLADGGTMLVLSHNPGSAELVDRLVDSVPTQFDRWDVERFPTAAIAIIEIDGNWDVVAKGLANGTLEGTGVLTDFHVPR